MPRKKISRTPREDLPATPSQQDEADILDELDAKEDENGDLIVNEEKVLEEGAVDAESIRENRRVSNMVAKKRANVPNVSFNIGDLVAKYDAMMKTWAPNQLDISVKRLTGTPVQHMITSRPRSGAELYEAMKLLHGIQGESDYEVRFTDTNRKSFAGTGRITMPDTRNTAQQQNGVAQMNGYYPPPPQGYIAAQAPAPGSGGYPPGYVPPGYTPPAPPVATPAPIAPPATAAAAAAAALPGGFQDMAAIVEAVKQMKGLLDFMQPQPAQAAPTPPPPPAPIYIPAPPPPPPPGADLPTQLAYIQQTMGLLRDMQAPPQAAPAPAVAAVAPAPQPAPGVIGAAPPIPTPPGMVWVPPLGFLPIKSLLKIMGGESPSEEQPRREFYQRPTPLTRERERERDFRQPQQRDDYERQRPEFDRNSDFRRGGQSQHERQYAAEYERPQRQRFDRFEEQQPQHQPPPQDAIAQFREAMTFVTKMSSAVEEIKQGLPGQRDRQERERDYEPEDRGSQDDEENSPIRIIDTGAAKLVVNRVDGSLRKLETGWANMDKIMKWAGEETEKFRRSQQERGQPQQIASAPERQLPPGYVEVGPGYRPPPGFVAVPVDPREVRERGGYVDAPPQQYSGDGGYAPPPHYEDRHYAEQQRYSEPPQHAPEQHDTRLPPPPADLPPPIRQTWGVPVMPDREGN